MSKPTKAKATKQMDLPLISIQCCQNCQSHAWCSRHDQSKYHQHFTELKRKIQGYIPNILILKNQVPASYRKLNSHFSDDNRYYDQQSHKVVQFPQSGAFEIYADNVLIFSKVQSNLWPNHNRILDLIQAVIEEKQQAGKVEKFALENRIRNDTDEMFVETYNRIIQRELRKQAQKAGLARSNVVVGQDDGVGSPYRATGGIRVRKHQTISLKKEAHVSRSRYEPQQSPIQRKLDQSYNPPKIQAEALRTWKPPRTLVNLQQQSFKNSFDTDRQHQPQSLKIQDLKKNKLTLDPISSKKSSKKFLAQKQALISEYTQPPIIGHIYKNPIHKERQDDLVKKTLELIKQERDKQERHKRELEERYEEERQRQEEKRRQKLAAVEEDRRKGQSPKRKEEERVIDQQKTEEEGKEVEKEEGSVKKKEPKNNEESKSSNIKSEKQKTESNSKVDEKVQKKDAKTEGSQIDKKSEKTPTDDKKVVETKQEVSKSEEKVQSKPITEADKKKTEKTDTNIEAKNSDNNATTAKTEENKQKTQQKVKSQPEVQSKQTKTQQNKNANEAQGTPSAVQKITKQKQTSSEKSVQKNPSNQVKGEQIKVQNSKQTATSLEKTDPKKTTTAVQKESLTAPKTQQKKNISETKAKVSQTKVTELPKKVELKIPQIPEIKQQEIFNNRFLQLMGLIPTPENKTAKEQEKVLEDKVRQIETKQEKAKTLGTQPVQKAQASPQKQTIKQQTKKQVNAQVANPEKPKQGNAKNQDQKQKSGQLPLKNQSTTLKPVEQTKSSIQTTKEDIKSTTVPSQQPKPIPKQENKSINQQAKPTNPAQQTKPIVTQTKPAPKQQGKPTVQNQQSSSIIKNQSNKSIVASSQAKATIISQQAKPQEQTKPAHKNQQTKPVQEAKQIANNSEIKHTKQEIKPIIPDQPTKPIEQNQPIAANEQPKQTVPSQQTQPHQQKQLQEKPVKQITVRRQQNWECEYKNGTFTLKSNDPEPPASQGAADKPLQSVIEKKEPLQTKQPLPSEMNWEIKYTDKQFTVGNI